jgi:integrase
MKKLSVYMGHASIQITMDRYGHLLPGSEADDAAMFGAFLSGERRRGSNEAR